MTQNVAIVTLKKKSFNRIYFEALLSKVVVCGSVWKTIYLSRFTVKSVVAAGYFRCNRKIGGIPLRFGLAPRAGRFRQAINRVAGTHSD